MKLLSSVHEASVLEAVKRHAFARFTSTYTVWFVPSPSASPRKRKLKVTLASKSGRKVADGKTSAAYSSFEVNLSKNQEPGIDSLRI